MTQTELLLVLLSWAAHFSGYDMQEVPEVRYVSHEYLVTHACYGKECRVTGWYNDQDTVYIIDKYKGRLNEPLPSSLLVHEFVHYLQDMSGYWRKMTCEERVLREREAYYVQTEYIREVLTSRLIVPFRRVEC